MRRAAVRATFAVAIGAGVVRLLVACSEDYAGTESPGGADGATESGTPSPPDDSGSPPSDSASDSACAVRYMPAEGTYAYATIFSSDDLKINDGAVDTQPFDSPYFGTIVHEPNGCFRFTVYPADGPKGRHDHSWKFCNACDRDAASLDLVEETDRFEVTSLGVKQESKYTCTRPNPFLVSDVPPDSSITQGACTGQSTGTQSTTIQVVPTQYVYEGMFDEDYQVEEASVPTHRFSRYTKSLLAGSNDPPIDRSDYSFDVDSGMPFAFLMRTTTESNLGGAMVTYKLGLLGRRSSSAVSPVLVDP